MSSQFDDLLGDLGDTNSSATIKTGGDNTGAEDSGLLLDFSAETEVTNGQSNGFEMDSSSSANPLYDLSADDSQTQSSNPLYDFSVTADANANTSSSTGNPLYDLTTEEEEGANQESAVVGGRGGADTLLFDFNAEQPDADSTTNASSANPLYDFDTLATTTTTAVEEGEEKQVGHVEDDFLLGTNETAGQSDQYADLLGGFSNDQQSEQQPEQQQEDTFQGEQEQADYSGSEVNGGGGALFDLGPTDTTPREQEETVTTSYQEETPDVAPEEAEQIPEEALNEEEAETTEQAPEEAMKEEEEMTATEHVPEEALKEEEEVMATEHVPEEALKEEEEVTATEHVPEEALKEEEDVTATEHVPEEALKEEEVTTTEHVPGEAMKEEEVETATDELDLVVREEGDEGKVEEEIAPVVEDQPEHAESGREEQKVEINRTEGDGMEHEGEQREDEQEQPHASDSTGNDGAYHADRREEDLEQYCVDRDEETSGVSDGVGEAVAAAAASEDRDQQEAEESVGQEVDQAEEIQQQQQQTQDQFADDQEAASSQADVPEVEKEESVAEEAAAPQQEEDDGPRETPSTSFTSSSTIVLLASPTSPTPPSQGRHREGSVSIIGIASVQPEAVAVTEEEVIQDGHTVSKSTRTENRYSSGSGFEDSRITEEATSTPVQTNYSRTNEPAMNTQPTVPLAAPRTAPQPSTLYDDDDDEEEEGVYENEPERRDDLVREGDKKEQNLPAAGTAQNLRAKFLASSQETYTPRGKREITPPNPTMGGGEYVSEPREQTQHYEGKADSGVFESQPVYNEDVVRAGTHQQDTVPEHGFAKNTVAKYKKLESEKKVVTSSGKRELTPDRSTRVEYVSEPRNVTEHYEGKAESGVFESQPIENKDVVRSGQGAREELPERGTARNLADKYRQISVDNSTSGGNREAVEVYEARAESGVFENQPQEEAGVVKAASAVEEFVPERGYTKNVAARFKELESTAKSPPVTPGRRKEFTPPRDVTGNQQSGVYESNPQINPEVVTSSEPPAEILPEQGTARNIAQRFRKLEAESKSPPSPKAKKEFTPPPRDVGVYENQPERFQADYNRPAESGILENNPQARGDDVTHGSEPPKYAEELPERGTARNLLSRWKQMETEKGKSPGSGVQQKEFTPPREEPRIAQQSKSPRTPKSPPANGSMGNGSVHPSDLPGQYQPQNAPSVVESTPEERGDVTREGDTDWSQGMPKKNTAKKMLARFQNIQAGANKDSPRPEARKESESDTTTPTTITPTFTDEEDPAMQSARLKFEDPDKVGRSKSMRAAIQVEKCGACDKTVYAMERLEMNKKVYHRACFRCSQCKSVLTAKTFAINNDIIFCTTHYKQLFTRKGNYDEGFGRTQHKTRWNSNPNIADAVNKEEEASRSQTEVKS